MALSAKSMRQLTTCLQITQSPWASVHITMLPPGYVRLAMRYGLFLLLPPGNYNGDRFINQVKKLQAGIDVPVIIGEHAILPHEKIFV